jgi:hypothetical protein
MCPDRYSLISSMRSCIGVPHLGESGGLGAELYQNRDQLTNDFCSSL